MKRRRIINNNNNNNNGSTATSIVGSSSVSATSSSTSSPGPSRKTKYLPYGVIRNIFAFLSPIPDLLRAAQVCKEWNSLYLDESLWRWISFSKVRSINNSSLRKHFLAQPLYTNLNKERVLGISFSGCSWLTSVGFIAELKNLKVLNLNLLNDVSSATLIKIFKSCQHLEKVKLHKCAMMDDNCVRYLVQNSGETLLELDISHARDVTSVSVVLILKHCPNLEDLNINYCERVADRNPQAERQLHEWLAAASFSSEEAPTTSTTTTTDSNNDSSNNNMAAKTRTYLPNLKRLGIAAVGMEDAVQVLLQSTNIEHLDLRSNVLPSAIADAVSFSKLKSLDASWSSIADDVLLKIAREARHTLTSLKLNGTQVEADTIEQIVDIVNNNDNDKEDGDNHAPPKAKRKKTKTTKQKQQQQQQQQKSRRCIIEIGSCRNIPLQLRKQLATSQ